MELTDSYIVYCDECSASAKVTETFVESGIVEGIGVIICPACSVIIRRVKIKGYVSVVLVTNSRKTDK